MVVVGAGIAGLNAAWHLRKAGIRHADLKGFMYSREDVTARSLANGYSQSLGTVFSQEMKPLEVEILVVQVGINGHPNEMYRISFDGSIIDEKNFAVIGGKSEAVQSFLKDKSQTRSPALGAALTLCLSALEQTANQKLPPEGLEVAVLDRNRAGRKFRRLSVLARDTSLALAGNAAADDMILRLGVRYSVEGSVRRMGSRLLVTVSLNNIISNRRLWAESYKGELEELPSFQEDVARSIASAIPVEIEPGATGSPSGSGDRQACCFRNLFETAVRIAEQPVESVVSHENIGVAVVIVICRTGCLRPAGCVETG